MTMLQLQFEALLLLLGCVTLVTANQSTRYPDLSAIPVSELQRLRDVASAIHSKIIIDLGWQMKTNRKTTATTADHKRQVDLTKKMIAMKLFMHEINQEQTKRRWTRDADWVSNDGQVEWTLDYSHGDEAWVPAIDKSPAKPTPENHQTTVKNSHSGTIGKTSVKQKTIDTVNKAPSRDNSQYSDNSDDGKLIILMTVGIVALLLATTFIIYTTIQWVRTLEALRVSEANNRENEIMRLLEEQGDSDHGILSQKKDYSSLDFDAMVGLVDTSDIPAAPPPKPSRRSSGSDPMIPNESIRGKPPRPSAQKMAEFKKRNNQ